jgi:hypothetical protein
MSAQDNQDDTGTAAKRPTYHYYLDIRNDGKGVGPHTPARINWWLERQMISPEIPARRTDQTQWTKLSEIKRFSNFLSKISKLPPPSYERAPWEAEPATEKQLKKLGHFDLPFPQANLTKGEASRLIEFFIGIDPEREEQYQNQPADEEKRNKLLQLIKRLPSSEQEDYPVTRELTNAEATESIDEIKDRLEELQSEKDEEDIELMFIDIQFNDEDLREDFGYKKLSNKQLKQLGEYLNTNDPGWESKSKYDTAKVVLKLFPEQKKAEKRLAHASHKRSHAQSSKGCLLIIVPLAGILLHVLMGTVLHIK